MIILDSGQKMFKEPSSELDQLVKRVIGAAIEVHRVLGPGYKESTYEKALCLELGFRNIPFQRQAEVSVYYKNVQLGHGLIDILVDNQLIVELKTVDALHPVHKAQVISYLKATNLQLGLLINFNTALLKNGIKRIIYTK